MTDLAELVTDPVYLAFKGVYDKRSEIMKRLLEKGVVDSPELVIRTEKIWNYLRQRKLRNYLKEESNPACYAPNQANS